MSSKVKVDSGGVHVTVYFADPGYQGWLNDMSKGDRIYVTCKIVGLTDDSLGLPGGIAELSRCRKFGIGPVN